MRRHRCFNAFKTWPCGLEICEAEGNSYNVSFASRFSYPTADTLQSALWKNQQFFICHELVTNLYIIFRNCNFNSWKRNKKCFNQTTALFNLISRILSIFTWTINHSLRFSFEIYANSLSRAKITETQTQNLFSHDQPNRTSVDVSACANRKTPHSPPFQPKKKSSLRNSLCVLLQK